MKKFHLVCSLLLISSCTHRQVQSQMKKDPSPEVHDLIEITENDQEENTHEMAEADANDQVIENEVGAKEIDAELPDSESDQIPYSRNFLLKKNTKRMQFWVDYFTKKERARFQRFINNGQEYRHHIEKIFQEHGLPKELYFVGLIESGYYLGARSHAAAVGPWQFIRGTGKRYGLQISHELDERQDLFKATRAAAMYFKDLHNIFSSWELALSAYNAGENGIIRRIMKHGTRDFYQLSRNKQLPSETINYVPKVLAAMHVVNNAEKYGFVLPKKKQRFFDLTELKAVGRNVPLSSIAARLNVDMMLLKKLNPELRRNATPRYVRGSYYLRVPKSQYVVDLGSLESVATTSPRKETRKELTRRTASVPTTHRVKKGETLFSIARKYDMSPRELASLNNFKNWRTKLKVGQRLSLAKTKTPRSPLVYQVRRGDNLMELARIFNTPLSKIKTANKMKKGTIKVGQKLILPDTQKGIYTVKHGDHLARVAKNFKLPPEALVRLNSLKQKKIYPGQKIIVNMD